jgi:GNAT superfamily N-acetyltransferase
MTKRPLASEPAPTLTIEDVSAEWIAYQEGIPGVEVHCDPDIYWMVEAGSAWSNCGARLRFTATTAARRLDEILRRYRKNGRGAGFWVGPFSEPENLEEFLRRRGLRCRRYFPGMYKDLGNLPRVAKSKLQLTFEIVSDYSIFQKYPHPAIGPLTTRIRKFRIAVEQFRAGRKPRKAWEIMAVSEGVPIGICTLFAGQAAAGFFNVAVLERARNHGVGTALVAHACRFAREQGCKAGMLISSGMGYEVYKRAGFREVAKIGFWYTAKP